MVWCLKGRREGRRKGRGEAARWRDREGRFEARGGSGRGEVTEAGWWRAVATAWPHVRPGRQGHGGCWTAIAAMSTASRTAGARAASTGPAGGATTSRNVRAAPGCGGRGARGCSESGGARATWGPPYSARPCVVNTARSASILQLRAGGSRTRASLSSPASGAALAARRRGVTRRRRGAPRFDPAQRRARAEGGHTGPPHTKQRAEKHDHDPHGAPSTPSRPRQSAALPGRLRVGSGWHCGFLHQLRLAKFPFRCRHRSPNRRLSVSSLQTCNTSRLSCRKHLVGRRLPLSLGLSAQSSTTRDGVHHALGTDLPVFLARVDFSEPHYDLFPLHTVCVGAHDHG